jgi:hypothetical protein
MNILVLNKNIIVSKLISLSVEEFDVNIIEVDSSSQIMSQDEYDIVFIDDSCYNSGSVDFINNITSSIKIVLYTNESDNIQQLHYDFKIKKPFLPSAIVDILNEVIQKDIENLSDSNDLSILLDYDDVKVGETIEESQLNQVDSIKDFLVDDSLNEIDDTILKDENTISNDINGNDLLELLLDTKVETLKHIFKGAEITINIKFPKDNI